MLQVTQRARFVFSAVLLAGIAGFMASGLGGSAQAQSGSNVPAGYVPSDKGFVENRGQYHDDVRYKLSQNGIDVWLTDRSVMYSTLDAGGTEAQPLGGVVPNPDGDGTDVPLVSGHALEVEFVTESASAAFERAGTQATLDAANPLPGLYNWLIDDSAVAGARAYGNVTYREVWPGIDVSLTSVVRPILSTNMASADKSAGDVEKDHSVLKTLWTLAPGADVDAIRLRYSGADAIRVDASGALVVETPVGNLVESAPFAYQIVGGERRVIASAYTVDALLGEVGFTLGAYDAGLPLYIDPVVLWSRIISGSSSDYATSVHEDASGNLYYTGMTLSTNFPTTSGVIQPTPNVLYDCYATKTDSTNDMLIWSTYLGGSSSDYDCSSVLEPTVNQLVLSMTSFGTTPGTPTFIGTTGGVDWSVVRLNGTATAILDSADVGGSSTDYAFGIVRLGNGNFAVVGMTFSSFGWPALGGAVPAFIGSSDANVIILNNALNSAVGYSYTGGTSTDGAIGVAVDSADNIYVHYVTTSTDVPMIAGSGGGNDMAISKFNSTATTRNFNGRIGGSSVDGVISICQTCTPFYMTNTTPITVDASNQAVMVGVSLSTNFPTTPGAFRATNPGNYSWTVTKVNASGTGLVGSTYIGGSSTDVARGVEIGPNDNIYVVGTAASANFPTTPGEVQTTNGGNYDYVRTIFNPDLTDILCGTYWGGNSTDVASDLEIPANYQAIITGHAFSTNFPIRPTGSPVFGTAGSYQIGNVRLNCGGAFLELVDAQFINLGPRLRPLIRPVPFTVEPAPATEAVAGELPYAENVPFQRPEVLNEECLAPGNFIEVIVTIENTGLTDQLGAGPEFVGSWNGSLFAGQPGSCEFFIGTGTCTVTASTVEVDADIPAGEQIQFAWVGRLVGGLPSGTVIEIASTLFFDTDDDGINDAEVELDPIEMILDCVPTVDPNRQLGRQVHLPILNFQGQDDVCDTWIEVQNIGCEFAKAALITWGEPGFCPPQAAGPLKVECTGILKPGSTWNLFGAQVPTGSKGGMLFKFSVKQLSELPAPLAFPPDDITADYLCESLFFGVVGDADDYRRFKKAYNEGLEFDLVPLDRASGDGILAVDVHRTCPGDVTPGVKVTSKYNGIAGSHLGAYDDVFGGFSYYVPLVYADKAGFNTIIYIQNGGLNCSSIEMWFKAQDDCLRAKICETSTLAPGETFQMDASECVGPEFQGSVWIRTSQVMGIAVDIIGKDVLMTYIGEPGEINYTFDPSMSTTVNGNQVAFGPLIYSEYQGWDTGIQVQNLSGVVAAKVKVYFLDRSGGIITTLVDWICPRGSQTFFLPVIFDLPGNWVGSMRAESQEWFSPGGPNVRPPNIVGVVTLIKYNDAARTETQEAIAYNLLPEHKIFDWQLGFAGGGLDSGVGLIAIPSLLKDLDNTGLTSEIAIANVVPKPGFTDLVIYFYDQNGLLDYICQKLNEKQVEYIDLQTWGYVNPGFKGSAIISAWFWEHDVFDDTGFFLRNLVGLGAVSIERSGTRLGEDAPGDEAAGSRGIPFRQQDIEDLELEFCFMGFAPLCPGFPRPGGADDEVVCNGPPEGLQEATLGSGGPPGYAGSFMGSRIFRPGGGPSTCGNPGACSVFAGSYSHDVYHFQNCDLGTHCYSLVVTNVGCTQIHTFMTDGRYDPDLGAFVCPPTDFEVTTLLGQSNTSILGGASQTIGFEVPSGAEFFSIDFHNPISGSNCAYTWTLTEQ